MRSIITVLLTFALTGCTPSLIAGNEAGGMVSHGDSLQADKAFAVADAHCHQFGKVARISSQDIWNNTMTFDCVKL
jgi:hypothetical protein